MEKKITYKRRTNLFKTDAWKRFSKNKLALIGSVIILLMIAAAILAPLIVQNDPYVSLTDANGLILKNSSPAKSGTIRRVGGYLYHACGRCGLLLSGAFPGHYYRNHLKAQHL